MKLLLIRHAESESNVRKVLDTALPGPPLTHLGHRQAAALATKIKSLVRRAARQDDHFEAGNAASELAFGQ